MAAAANGFYGNLKQEAIYETFAIASGYAQKTPAVHSWGGHACLTAWPLLRTAFTAT
jgi:hypothetical protein